jgi:hypothetical protein
LVMTMDAGQESIQIQQLGNCHRWRWNNLRDKLKIV